GHREREERQGRIKESRTGRAAQPLEEEHEQDARRKEPVPGLLRGELGEARIANREVSRRGAASDRRSGIVPGHRARAAAAGGGNDIIVRVLAPKMSEGLGQPIIVENKPGAQSIIAAEYVAKSAPDGYTLFMGPSGAMTMNPAIYSKLPYSPLRDFAQVSMIGDFPLILVVNSSLPVNSVKELIDYAKARPGEVNYSASSAPFQLAAELFNQKTGTRFAHIPYKSSGDSVGAVMSGQVTMTIMDPPPAIGPLKGGKVKGVAVTSAKR